MGDIKQGSWVWYIGNSNTRLERGDRGYVGEVDTSSDAVDRNIFVSFGNGFDWSVEGWFSADDLATTDPSKQSTPPDGDQ